MTPAAGPRLTTGTPSAGPGHRQTPELPGRVIRGVPSTSQGRPPEPHLVIQEVQVVSLRLPQLHVVQHYGACHAAAPKSPGSKQCRENPRDSALARKLPKFSRHGSLRWRARGAEMHDDWLIPLISGLQLSNSEILLVPAFPSVPGLEKWPLFLLPNRKKRRLKTRPRSLSNRKLRKHCILGVVVPPPFLTAGLFVIWEVRIY